VNPVEFEGQTTLLAPPAGTPRGECGALPVRIVPVPGSTYGGHILSYWRPTPEELAELNAGAHVRLAVHGGGHPPVWIDVERCQELP
jgi:hypothetical protein